MDAVKRSVNVGKSSRDALEIVNSAEPATSHAIVHPVMVPLIGMSIQSPS
jgi:hypothetical protein